MIRLISTKNWYNLHIQLVSSIFFFFLYFSPYFLDSTSINPPLGHSNHSSILYFAVSKTPKWLQEWLLSSCEWPVGPHPICLWPPSKFFLLENYHRKKKLTKHLLNHLRKNLTLLYHFISHHHSISSTSTKMENILTIVEFTPSMLLILVKTINLQF